MKCSVDLGVKKAGDVSADASSDPSDKDVEGILVKHLGRSLREGDWDDPQSCKNPRAGGVDLLVFDRFSADASRVSHGEKVAYVAEQASHRGVEVSRWDAGTSSAVLADKLMAVAFSKDPPEVINLSISQKPQRLFFNLKVAELGKRYKERYGLDISQLSQWPARTRKKCLVKLQKLAERAVVEFKRDHRNIIPDVEKAVQALLDRGITVVIASGNEGGTKIGLNRFNLNIPDGFWNTIYGQSVYADGVIVVGATNAKGQPASFSTPNGFTDVAALGVHVPVDSAGRVEVGTSYSAPKVAALAADLLVIRPDLTPADVEAIIRQSASAVDGAEASMGAGRVNPDKARELARYWVN